ncbi:hypothetical protein HDU98_011154 [Podochytrium sp. JEL0797]|nr:hypothetical protein HDU98_011154 [Podochytrium sp. JEL0797]
MEHQESDDAEAARKTPAQLQHHDVNQSLPSSHLFPETLPAPAAQLPPQFHSLPESSLYPNAEFTAGPSQHLPWHDAQNDVHPADTKFQHPGPGRKTYTIEKKIEVATVGLEKGRNAAAKLYGLNASMVGRWMRSLDELKRPNLSATENEQSSSCPISKRRRLPDGLSMISGGGRRRDRLNEYAQGEMDIVSSPQQWSALPASNDETFGARHHQHQRDPRTGNLVPHTYPQFDSDHSMFSHTGSLPAPETIPTHPYNQPSEGHSEMRDEGNQPLPNSLVDLYFHPTSFTPMNPPNFAMTTSPQTSHPPHGFHESQHTQQDIFFQSRGLGVNSEPYFTQVGPPLNESDSNGHDPYVPPLTSSKLNILRAVEELKNAVGQYNDFDEEPSEWRKLMELLSHTVENGWPICQNQTPHS